ncbi:MAG: uroporphyrinogen-III synthase [Oceanibaculum nanhaiense]|uniref:uroporphyrinogen-III synthase n=1 Tax=Oceanibaculum nanhaiense TaxID=1909734 RepID=UPI0025A3CD95|nr:uroporphyrinogen-III synthase [Oceanibaculum nanhaiense]MDM7944857.1 uroporphyrinogen-III synthase [Oceanibaculum nanhaiense]
MRVLLTRPEPDSTALAARLKNDGIDSVIAPLLEIVPRDPGPPPVPMDSVQALLVTSANAAERLSSVTERRDVRVLCVGAATAEAVRAQGFDSVESADGAIEELTALALGTLDPKAGPVLHLSGETVAGDLAGMLRLAGFEAHRLVVYEARPAEALPPRVLAELRRGRLDAVLFFSPRTAETFVRLVKSAGLAGQLDSVAAVAISDKAADACRTLPWRSVLVAASPDLPGMMAALTQMATAQAKPVDGAMSEQDKDQKAKPKPESAKPAESPAVSKASPAGAAGAKPADRKPDDRKPEGPSAASASSAAAPRRSRAKLYGYGVLALVVLAIVAFGTLPLWRPTVQPYLSQIGITLPDLTPASAEDQRLTALTERVAALEATPRQAGTAPQELADLRTALEARITGLEERQTALSEEIQLVREMLAGEGTASSAAAPSALPAPEIMDRLEKLEQQAQALAQAQAGLDGEALRGRVAALETRLADMPRTDPQEMSRLREDMGALKQSLSEIETGAGEREALVLAAAQLAGPLQQGLSYEIELAALKRTAGADPLVAEIAVQLQPYAAQGVPTLEALRQRFPDVAGEAVRAARVGESDSVVGQTLNRIAGLVSLRRVGQVEGDTAEARIARAEAALARGDLAAVLGDLEGLPTDAATVVAGWRADAEARLAADKALARLRDHLLAGLTQPAAQPATKP